MKEQDNLSVAASIPGRIDQLRAYVKALDIDIVALGNGARLSICPHCNAANGNADLPRANTQALEPRQARRIAAEVAERKFADHMENP